MGGTLTGAPGIPYPEAAEVADHIRRVLGNRIARVPAIRPSLAARALGTIALILWPSPAGLNSDMANPAEWLSPGQRDWAAEQSSIHNIPSGSLEQGLANYHRHQLTENPDYVMTSEDYDAVLDGTIEHTQGAQVVAAAPSGPDEDNVRITRTLAATLGACAALACPPQVNRFNGGAHACTSQPPNDNRDSHHMPADSQTAMPRPMGPAIQMTPTDHAMTDSYKGRVNGARYALQRELIAEGDLMGAFMMDAANARAIAMAAGDPARYDAAIAQATAYALCLQAHGLLR